MVTFDYDFYLFRPRNEKKQNNEFKFIFYLIKAPGIIEEVVIVSFFSEKVI